MQDEEVEQSDEAVEPTAEDTSSETETETEGAGDDEGMANAVDMQAAESSGSTALKEPEVPDDAQDKIAAAQEHINKLDMDAEREAAERAQKNT